MGTSLPGPFPTAGAGGEAQRKAVTTASQAGGERGWECMCYPVIMSAGK